MVTNLKKSKIKIVVLHVINLIYLEPSTPYWLQKYSKNLKMESLKAVKITAYNTFLYKLLNNVIDDFSTRSN